MVAQTEKAEPEGSQVPGSLGYTERPCLKTQDNDVL
jgi:hypothetical protein